MNASIEQSELDRARAVYETAYRVDWRNRAYMWHPRNNIALIHAQTLDFAIANLLNAHNIDLVGQRVLDVGCGYGRLLRLFAEFGASPRDLFGVDLALYRLQHAHALSTLMALQVSNISELPFADSTFFMVSQFAVFSSVHLPALRVEAAREMTRVLKPGGWLLWYDIAAGESSTVQSLDQASVQNLFPTLTLRATKPIFTRGLSQRIRRFPAWAIAREQVPFGKRNGLLMLFQRPFSTTGNA